MSKTHYEKVRGRRWPSHPGNWRRNKREDDRKKGVPRGPYYGTEAWKRKNEQPEQAEA